MTGHEPGVYDIPEAEYFSDPALSCSGAKLLLSPSCPARFKYRQDHPASAERKDVFDFGSAAHEAILGAGPGTVIIDADSWQTKAARDKRDAARAEGRTPLLVADAEKITAMSVAIWRHPIAGALLDPDRGGQAEQSLFWEDEETGVRRRARLDWLPVRGQGRFIAVDLKTCTSADPDAIAKATANFGYYMQDAWYLDGIRAAGLDDDPAFVFIFIEKEPPYLVNVIQLNDEARAAGRARNRRAIEVFRDCTESGYWPGYEGNIEPGEIQQISLPRWAARALEVAW